MLTVRLYIYCIVVLILLFGALNLTTFLLFSAGQPGLAV